MKKQLITLLLLCGICNISFSQNTTNIQMSDANVDKAINLYLGPSFQYGIGVLVIADFEIPLFNENLTIGPSLGVGVTAYNTVETYNIGYGILGTRVVTKTGLILNPAVVGHYYFDWLIPNMSEKYDLFAKARVGAKLIFDSNSSGFNPFDVAVQAGGRINFSEKISMYGAVGYGHTYINFGLSVKL